MNLHVEGAKLRQEVFSTITPSDQRDEIVSLLDIVARHASNASRSNDANVRQWNISRGESLLKKAKRLFSRARENAEICVSKSFPFPALSKTRAKGASFAKSQRKKAEKAEKDRELRKAMRGGFSKKR